MGLVLEARVAGGRVGVTTQCLLVDTFRRIRDGDRSVAASHWLTALLTCDWLVARFWYEAAGVLRPAQLAQVRQVSLARVLCDNGDTLARVAR